MLRKQSINAITSFPEVAAPAPKPVERLRSLDQEPPERASYCIQLGRLKEQVDRLCEAPDYVKNIWGGIGLSRKKGRTISDLAFT